MNIDMNSLKILAVIMVVICIGSEVAQANDKSWEADVVVYGDAAGGVTAAVQAARMGKKVILVSPCGHLGGMTSSGLGWTDIGNPAILGGLSREFYHRVYEHYQIHEDGAMQWALVLR
jgi:ribulose 1,5-bisphosphate synthetase/thiazole synthase